MRNVPLKGRTMGVGSAPITPVAGSAVPGDVTGPTIEPSGMWWRTVNDRSTLPLNVPVITGRSGTWTELLPGALTTTSNVPLTGPVPLTVETLSVPVAMTVQLSRRGTEIKSSDGH